jgi:hypothetical protein
MVWLKTLIFTVVASGAIMALIPYLLLSRTPRWIPRLNNSAGGSGP